MAGTHGFMEIHYGRNTSPRNPGSLAFHNNLLDRKPIVLSSLPSFRESRDLVFVSLYARVLHCLELVSGCETLEDYAKHVTFDQLKLHAMEIVQRYADGKTVGRLRSARTVELRELEQKTARATEPPGTAATPVHAPLQKPVRGPPDAAAMVVDSERTGPLTTHTTSTSESTAQSPVTNQDAESHDHTRLASPPPAGSEYDTTSASTSTPSRRLTQGDMVFENAVLYIRDALILRLLTDTIKSGNSGRLVLVLKVLALYYRGCGRTKYAQEVLFLIHNLTHVWPAPLREIIVKNWLVNPTGRENAWVEVDLLQEHLNFWIKTIYQAHGSSQSWDWLAMISPCVDVLRRLATHINSTLGAQQGTKHANPSLERDIAHLMASLRRFQVYELDPGREIDDGSDANPVVPDSLTVGLQRLSEPLADFNATFAKLKARCGGEPLRGGRYPGADSNLQPAANESGVRTHASEPLTGDNVTVEGAEGDALGDDSHADDSDGESTDEDHEPQVLMSLDTAGDVALDMDGDGEDFFE